MHENPSPGIVLHLFVCKKNKMPLALKRALASLRRLRGFRQLRRRISRAKPRRIRRRRRRRKRGGHFVLPPRSPQIRPQHLLPVGEELILLPPPPPGAAVVRPRGPRGRRPPRRQRFRGAGRKSARSRKRKRTRTRTRKRKCVRRRR